jgi:hypothetical protein
VLFPLIELLRGDSEVHVVAPKALFEIDLLSSTRHLYTAWPLKRDYVATRWRGLAGLVRKYRAIRRTVGEIRPEFILFNSTYRRFERFLIVWWLRGFPKGQVIHEFQHFLKIGGHWLYDRFDVNVVISEQVFGYVQTHHPEFAGLDYFLPIFFDDFIAAVGGSPPSPSPDGSTVKLGVFGSIDGWRRNYRGLLDAVWATTAGRAEPQFELFLVGKAPLWLQREIRQHRSGAIVQSYPEFVPFQRMFELLAEVDLVLFLIDGSVGNSQLYNRYKISGTSTLMKAFKTAGACSTEFLVDESLADRCFFYEGADVQSLLTLINEGKLTRADIATKLLSAAEPANMGLEDQRARLVGLIARASEKRAGRGVGWGRRARR